jgi:hypothetical protein
MPASIVAVCTHSILDKEQKDGEALTLPTKDLGSTEVYPQSLQHSPNGRFVAVCGDGEVSSLDRPRSFIRMLTLT